MKKYDCFRDFVNLRHWALVDGVFVSAGVSVQHPAMPPQPKKIRYYISRISVVCFKNRAFGEKMCISFSPCNFFLNITAMQRIVCSNWFYKLVFIFFISIFSFTLAYYSTMNTNENTTNRIL